MSRDTLTRTPSGAWRTRTGVVIGGAYIPPRPDIGKHAEAVQRAILEPRRSLLGAVLELLGMRT